MNSWEADHDIPAATLKATPPCRALLSALRNSSSLLYILVARIAVSAVSYEPRTSFPHTLNVIGSSILGISGSSILEVLADALLRWNCITTFGLLPKSDCGKRQIIHPNSVRRSPGD